MSEVHAPGPPATISLLDLVSVIVRRRRMIVLSTLTAALLIVAYSIYTIKAGPGAPFNLLPDVYRPVVQVRLQDSQGQSLSSFLSSSELGFLANLAGSSSGSPSSADLAQQLLVGKTLLDELADEFGVAAMIEADTAPKAAARSYLEESFDTSFESTTGILTIGFAHTDREFATAVLNSALAKLEERFKKLTLSSVDEKKRILEQSIADYSEELGTVQKALIDFQKQYGIFSIELQTEYKLQAVAEVDSQILSKQSELRSLVETRRADDPELRRTRMELETLEERREILLTGASGGSTPLNIPQAQLPELSARYLNLTRDLQIVQAIYGGLRSQYEILKIEEKDTSSQFQVIEQAELPELKWKPSRSKITVIFTVTVFFLAVFFAFILEYFDRVARDPVESAKLEEIRAMFERKRRSR
jgi:tyrosine-protein kinase Etk/Wzc